VVRLQSQMRVRAWIASGKELPPSQTDRQGLAFAPEGIVPRPNKPPGHLSDLESEVIVLSNVAVSIFI